MNVLIEKAKKLILEDLGQSKVLKVLKTINNREALIKKGRKLTGEEIEVLKREGNSSDSWEEIHVPEDFRPENIYNCFFSGFNYIGNLNGEIDTHLGVKVRAGLYNSHIQESVILNAKVQNVGLMVRNWVEDGAYISNVGTLVCSNTTHFSLGNPIHPGSESECRTVWMMESLDINNADWMSKVPPKEQETIGDLFQAYSKNFESDMGYVGNKSIIINSRGVINTYAGPHCLIDGANRVKDVALLSDYNNHAEIVTDSIVKHSVMQECARVTKGAMVTHSILTEHGEVGEKAVVHQSIIGPNTHILKGEVSSSLVGPFVGFHHQALLISVLWPVGKGNVASGANIGSNHTGRKPDQETKIGEGIFFGLSSHVKFPCNFLNAPHSLFATGVTLIPQKIELPFSLITPPPNYHTDIPVSYNEIIPGWMWGSNPYAVFRNMYKYRDRNKSKMKIQSTVFSRNTVKCVLNGYKVLTQSDTKDFYIDKDIPELGKNILAEKHRKQGVEAYKDYMYFYLLNKLIKYKESFEEDEYIKEACQLLGYEGSVQDNLLDGLDRIDQLVERVYNSIGRDEFRGQQIHDDYLTFHEPIREFPESDSVVKRLLAELELWKKELKTMKGNGVGV